MHLGQDTRGKVHFILKDHNSKIYIIQSNPFSSVLCKLHEIFLTICELLYLLLFLSGKSSNSNCSCLSSDACSAAVKLGLKQGPQRLYMRGSRQGDRGSGPPSPLETEKAIGFLGNTGPGPLKITKLPICLICFVALRPKSTAMVNAGRSVHLTTLFPGQAWTSG